MNCVKGGIRGGKEGRYKRKGHRYSTEAEFLDEIKTKVLRVSSLLFSVTSTALN
jgi:hypothetical protein